VPGEHAEKPGDYRQEQREYHPPDLGVDDHGVQALSAFLRAQLLPQSVSQKLP
jgi:hypothetical protein